MQRKTLTPKISLTIEAPQLTSPFKNKFPEERISLRLCNFDLVLEIYSGIFFVYANDRTTDKKVPLHNVFSDSYLPEIKAQFVAGNAKECMRELEKIGVPFNDLIKTIDEELDEHQLTIMEKEKKAIPTLNANLSAPVGRMQLSINDFVIQFEKYVDRCEVFSRDDKNHTAMGPTLSFPQEDIESIQKAFSSANLKNIYLILVAKGIPNNELCKKIKETLTQVESPLRERAVVRGVTHFQPAVERQEHLSSPATLHVPRAT